MFHLVRTGEEGRGQVRRRADGAAYWQPVALLVLPEQVTLQEPVPLQVAVQTPLQVMLQEPVPLQPTVLPAPTVTVCEPVPASATVEVFPAVMLDEPVPEVATLQLSPQVPLQAPVPLQVSWQLAVLAVQVPSELKSQVSTPAQVHTVPTQNFGAPQATRTKDAATNEMNFSWRMVVLLWCCG